MVFYTFSSVQISFRLQVTFNCYSAHLSCIGKGVKEVSQKQSVFKPVRALKKGIGKYDFFITAVLVRVKSAY